MNVIPFVAVECYRCACTSGSDCAHHANSAPSSMFANGAAAALNAFYCCPVVLTISGGSFGETLSREQSAAGCEQHFSRREGGVGMHGVAIHATQCQHRIGKQCIEAVRGIRDIVGRVATIARGNVVGARHYTFFFFYNLQGPAWYSTIRTAARTDGNDVRTTTRSFLQQ